MLERSKEGCSTDKIDDVTKTIKSALAGLKKTTPKETKLDSLVDIMELVKIAMNTSGITDSEFFAHLNKRREEVGVFAVDTKEEK